MNILVSLAVGALIGWLAGIIMKSKGGLVQNIIVGIVGSVVGGVIAKAVGIGGGWIVELLIAIAGGCLVLWIVNLIQKNKGKLLPPRHKARRETPKNDHNGKEPKNILNQN
ncbi:MAG: GlsB/YeaQ/YmgE family stress response membrane protein [Clostridia bacterium]|nr:GlsB/YeaQ/YmgE family stress response membrane protein [Clostridia bacterium]